MSDKFTAGVYQREPAWHAKGSVVQGDLRTWKDVKEHLGIDWDIASYPIRVDNMFVPGFKAAVRSDNGKVLAVNPSDYALVGINDFGMFVEQAMSEQAATWDAFVVMDGGRAVAATIKLDEPISVPGDPSPVYPYAGFSNRIDRKGALVFDPTAIRQVCWNTNSLFLMMAEDSGWSTSYRHTKSLDIEKATEEIKESIRIVRLAFDGFGDTAKALAETTIDVDKYVKQWLPVRQHMTDRVAANVNAKREAFWGALNGPRAVDRKDSAWGVLQASIDAYQYQFGVIDEDTGRVKRSISMIGARKGRGEETDDLRRAYQLTMAAASV